MPKSYDIIYFIDFANSKNGKCLSSEYKSLNTKLKWECYEGHIWETIPNSILRGTWCKICSGKANKTIQDMKKIAISRGGECLSEKYINGKSKLIWKCANGHVWQAIPNNINQGKWCPDCSTGLSERICRTYFEEIFKVPFPNTKGLKWLKNERGNYLELDGYNRTLKLAFEHQGEQHYDGESYFDKAKYDEIKSELCKNNGVILIHIPQLGVLLSHSNFHKLIKEKLKETRFCKYNFPPLQNIDLKRAYINRMDIEMQKLAKKRGGQFLSKNYLGSLSKHQWKCKFGHLWSTTPSAISSGNWCPKCAIKQSADKRKADFNEILSIIKGRQGLCLQTNYENSKSKIKIKCNEGHVWETLPSNLKKGHWCPACANQEKLTLDSLKELAESKKGKCLSTSYINANSLLKWQCEEGHTWEAPAGRIKTGSWCLKCSGSAKLTLSLFKEIAKERGGKCLSQEYINANSKLEWECSKGHRWFARANHIKRKSWCPLCKKLSSTKKRTLGISAMHELAKDLNGKCLSKEYSNNKSKLTWQCENGHTFEKSPSDLKRGRWCPECKKLPRTSVGNKAADVVL